MMSSEMKVAVFTLTSCALAWLAVPALSQQSLRGENAPVSYPILSGVGVALKESGDSIKVHKVLPGSAADRSKAIGAGDQIVSVENDGELVLVEGKTLGEVGSLIRGPVGSKVTLEIRPNQHDSIVKLSLIREAIRVQGVPSLTYRKLIGKAAPELSLFRFDDSAKAKLSQYRGKIVVLDFWASGCGACYKPIDELQALARSHPEWNSRVALLAISIDTDRERAADVIQEEKWNRTTNFCVDADALEAIGVKVLPMLMIVSPDGTIATMGESHAIDVETEVERLLASTESSRD